MDILRFRKLYDTVIYLISCAVAEMSPDNTLISMDDLRDIYAIAKRHSVSVLVTASLEKIGLASAEAILEKNMAIRKIMLLDAERSAIFSEFDKRGIKYMALKGVILKELYPSIGYRQMSDNDILIDPEKRKEVREIMVSRGFFVDRYDSGNHDVYKKEPVYNYEIHVSLFSSYSYETYAKYFDDALRVSVKDCKGEHGYRMTDDYYYVYIKTHEYKHHIYGGTGIRSLVDTYVYLNSKKNCLNEENIKAEIEKLGFSDYEEKTRVLSQKIFDPSFAAKSLARYAGDEADLLSEEERKFLDCFFFAGTYGTTAKQIENSIEKIAKEKGSEKRARRSLLLNKIFPPMSYYKEYLPFFYKHKILIPLFWIYRTFKLVFSQPKATYIKIKTILCCKKKQQK